jgi:MoxR-like ATPase
VAPPPRDPAVIVTFAGIPGLGKTELCKRLHERLAARHVVVHHHSDALGVPARKYWEQVVSLSVTHRGDGKATVVLADKNLVDNPRGTHR